MVNSTTTSASFHPASLLCQRDGNSSNPLPAICNQIFTKYIKEVPNSIKNISNVVVTNDLMGTAMLLEILKHLGLFIGVLASLALLTLLLCHRPRRTEVDIY